MKAVFSLDGQRVMSTDSIVKHAFTFTPAFSFFVDCESKEDIGRLTAALSSGWNRADAAWRIRLQPSLCLGQRPLRRFMAAQPRLNGQAFALVGIPHRFDRGSECVPGNVTASWSATLSAAHPV
jgi:hypothetical protein